MLGRVPGGGGGAPVWNLDTRSGDSEDLSSILRLDQ